MDATASITRRGGPTQDVEDLVVDGHDSRLTALNVEDQLVKDADKTWRLTPHGIDTVMDWFGLDRTQALRLCSARVLPHLFTDGARTMAQALFALESITVSPQMRPLLQHTVRDT